MITKRFTIQTEPADAQKVGDMPFGQFVTPAAFIQLPIAPSDRKRAENLHRGERMRLKIELTAHQRYAFELTRVA